ncbi:MAG: YicC/YloC family endoribonuclease [Planctomycetota bacterium]
MIRSMTGFGEATREDGGTHFALELRGLNNKYFKALVRLPDEINVLEAELESALRKRVNRGSFAVVVKLRLNESTAVSRVNDAAVLAYLQHLETLKHRTADHSVTIDLTALLTLPGVLQPAEDELALTERARPILKALLDEAIDKMNRMRQSEGAALADDLRRHCDALREQAATVEDRAPVVIKEYHEKLRARVDQLVAKAELTISQADLAKEVAVFADKADVSEELARTRTHLDHFERLLDEAGAEPVGRTLDFIGQELLREVNTIASKSNDAAISGAAVVMKSAIDRLKEQVQNVE